MGELKGKTIIVTGGSSGIGQAIALRYAAAGANIVIATKDSPANIKAVGDQIVAAGGQALVLNVDVSDDQAMKQAVAQAVDQFGGIDVLVNNTSATHFSDTLHTTPEKFDLVVATSVRAAFFMSQACFPHLKKALNPHIINISPPLNMDPNWFKDHLAFSLSKYAMSMCTLGMAVEFESAGIAVNSLWPETTIATQTIKDHFSPQVYAGSRWPSIMADAAYELVLRPAKECTGHFYTDEALLREVGIVDFSQYAVDLKAPLMQALFVPADSRRTRVSQELFLSK
jgi:citronellol/citronellal dehydrogenase